MSAPIHIEFAGGGPVDGRRRDMPDPGPEIRVYTPRTGELQTSYSPGDIQSSVGIDTHLYRRASRLTDKGYEIYAYAGKEKK